MVETDPEMAALEAERERDTTLRPRLAALGGFLRTEAGGAVVLLAAAVIALVWVNSAWADSYTSLWETEVGITWGDVGFTMSLAHWVNDGLMTLFFLLIGLEVRREFDMGEFRERKRVAVPLLAALGGMIVPVLIFLALNGGGEASRGWAMVMATDTAFAVGVLALVGRRSSFRLRSFLLTLVIVDDIAATLVIALVYTSELQPMMLAIAVGLLVLMAVFRAIGVQRPSIFWVLAVGIWLATLEGGVHPSIAGVAVGLLTSAYPPRRSVLEQASRRARAFRQRPDPELAREAARTITQSLSPNERLEHALHPWTSFVVVPLFALANAGIPLSAGLISDALSSTLVIGIVLGLVVGKTVGIPIGAWLATRPWLGGQALAIGWPSLMAAASVAGIGFTMSLLIAELSYTDPLLDQAKLGILTASVIAAVLSTFLFHAIGWLPREVIRRADARTSELITDLTVPVDPARDHIRGPLDAPVTLVEYGDFECPHCGKAAPIVHDLLERMGGKVRFVFRHLPLADIHPRARAAAEASEAAAAQGAFWEMHDRLFANQDDLDLHDLPRHAEALGLDGEAVRTALRERTYKARVDEDIASADAAGIAGTPTFFVDGVMLTSHHDRDALEAAVRRALREAELRQTEPSGRSVRSEA